MKRTATQALVTIAIALAIVVAVKVIQAHAQSRETPLYDKDGRYSGGVFDNGNGTQTYTDRNGHFSGSAVNNNLSTFSTNVATSSTRARRAPSKLIAKSFGVWMWITPTGLSGRKITWTGRARRASNRRRPTITSSTAATSVAPRRRALSLAYSRAPSSRTFTLGAGLCPQRLDNIYRVGLATDMTKLLIALATTVALVGPAHAVTLPKGLAGTWCSGKTDEKGETPYGPPLETGKCSGDGASVLGVSTYIFSSKSIRIQDPDLDDIVCRFEQFEAQLVKGVMRISFTAKCPEGRVKASGWFWEHKAMNLKWEDQ
jgi:hypothetical protein